MSILKKLASETALYGLSSIVGRLVTFVFLTPYLTHKFVPSDMGVQADIYAYAAFLMVFFTYRMETAFFRYGKEAADRPTVFRTAATAMYASTAVLVGAMLLWARPLAAWLEYPEHPEYIAYLALILGCDALAALPFARLRLEGRAKRFALAKLGNLAIQLGSIVVLLDVCPMFAWFDAADRVGYVFIANVLASAGTLLFLLPQFKFSFIQKDSNQLTTGVFDADLLRQMLAYAAPLMLAALAGIVNEVLDRVLLKNLLTGTLDERMYQVGIYSSCYKIAIFMNLFTQAFNYAAEPFFFKQANRADAKSLYADVALMFALVACVGFVGIVSFMDLAQYFVAADYRVGLGVVPILLLANVCLGLYYNVAIWFKLGDFTRYGAYIAVIGAGLTVVSNALLIPIWGYMGAAWATLICYAAMVVLGYAWGQVHYPIPYRVGKIVGHLAVAVGAYFAHRQLSAYIDVHFFVKQLINGAFFLLYLALVVILEKNTVRQILRRV